MRRILVLAIATLLGATGLALAASRPTAPQHTAPFHGLTFRNLGPAVGGGRTTAVLGVAGNPALYYVGTAGGGVWKTHNGGMSWKPIFTHEPTQSIGSLALAGGNPNWLWVGTGEANPRNDVLSGDGVYFSPDGGATWEAKGLRRAGQIAAIAVDPLDTNRVLVCAEGNIWKRGPERGIYLSTDNGAHWRRVLYLNDHTGCSTLAFEPGNPKVLIAGMWPLQRSAWMLTSGGKSGGLYRSTDGGVHWKKLTHGLPHGGIGRSAVAFAPSRPSTVYAVLQAKHGVLWVSHDLGSHWTLVSNNHSADVRPFYFTQLAVMPNNPRRLFLLSMRLMESTDGGKHFFPADKGVHGDHHAIWIDPRNAERIIQGNDGGVDVTLDAGKHWRYLNNLPIEQFYQVATSATNHPWPYLVCGGLQDNDAWCGASSDYRHRGVSGEQDWINIAAGDGEYVVPAASDANMIYATTEDGATSSFNRSTGRAQAISPYLRDLLAGLLFTRKPPSRQKYRFAWTTPIAVSPTNPDSLYLGANVLFHSSDAGLHWTVISPDLTRNVKSKQQPSGGPVSLDMTGATTYDVIQSIALAPSDPRVIWVGTDDGWVWVSRDGGTHWHNVTPPGAPQWTRVYHVEPSPFAAGTAYAAFDAHEIGNDAPYVYRTTDYGKHWTRITRGLPESSVEVVAEDPHHAGLLFAGTISAGLYVSFDDGVHWQPLQANLPHGLSVWDLTFAPDHRGLLLATHGRGIWVLDNLRPLEEYDAAVARAPFHAFTAAPGVLLHSAHGRANPPSAYVAPNAPLGAVISYHLAKALKPTPAQKAAHHAPVRIAIRDAAGTLVTTLHGPGKAGFNTVVWNLSYKAPTKLKPPLGTPFDQGFFGGGPSVLAGHYTATVHADAHTTRVTLKVEPDPLYPTTLATERADAKAGLATRVELSAVNRLLNHVAAMHTVLAGVLARGLRDAAWAHRHAALLAKGKKLQKTLAAYENVLWNTRKQHNAWEDFVAHFSRLHARLVSLYSFSGSLWGRKPRAQILELIHADHAEIERLLARYNATVVPQVKAWNSTAYAAGIVTLPTGGAVRLRTPPPLPPGGV